VCPYREGNSGAILPTPRIAEGFLSQVGAFPRLRLGSVGIVDLGAPELLIILVIAFLLFGANKLPKLARSLGQASKEFKAGTVEGWSGDDLATPPAAKAAGEPPRENPPQAGGGA
jgi:sec-independent protein translocase protein TatA